MTCLKCLHEQFTPNYSLNISKRCCYELKKKPARNYEQQSGRSIVMTGMRKAEGGNRSFIGGCVLTDKNGNLQKFHPLLVVSDEWEETFIKENKIDVCDLYKPPYNFRRTGCCGCPYNLELQNDLDVMARLLPNQRNQAEIIWKPIYQEYRRLGYRLRRYEKVDLLEEKNAD